MKKVSFETVTNSTKLPKSPSSSDFSSEFSELSKYEDDSPQSPQSPTQSHPRSDTQSPSLSPPYSPRRSQTPISPKMNSQINENMIGYVDQNQLIKVGTHDGRFHGDDVIACVIAKLKWGNIIITRSRDVDILDTCDILFAVGEKFDPTSYKFDHRQKNCNEKFDEASTFPLSSGGMAWKYFGKDIIKNLIKNILSGMKDTTSNSKNSSNFLSDSFVDHMHTEIYYKYIMEIDANDNGIPRLKNEVEAEETENYSFHTTLPNIVNNYNTDKENDDALQLDAFNRAMITVGEIFEIACKQTISHNMTFWNDYEKFIAEYDQPSKLPAILDVSNYTKTYRKLLDQYDPQREFVKFVYFKKSSKCKNQNHNMNKGKNSNIHNNSNGNSRNNDDNDEIWVVKTRNIPGKIFSNIIDIAPEDELKKVLSDAKADIEEQFESKLIYVHKKLYYATTTTSYSAFLIANYSLNRNKDSSKNDKPRKKNDKERTSSIEKFIDLTDTKVQLKHIGSSILIAAAALGFGYVLGKINN